MWPLLLIVILRPFWQSQKVLANFLAYLPIAIFASLRGIAGTDTQNYRLAYDYVGQLANLELGVDFGFTGLMFLMSQLELPFQAFATLQAALCLLLYCIAGAKLDKVSPLFSVGILPVYFLDSTFNGMRYGLAFAAAAFLLALFYERRMKISGLLLVLPTFIHSSLAPVALMSPFALGISAIILYFFGIDYAVSQFFVGKLDSYSVIFRPSIYSGIVPILQAIILLILFYKQKRKLKIGYNLRTFAIIITFGGYFISLYTYAGLRLLLLGVFILGISVSMSLQSSKYDKYIYLLYFLSVINFFRQIFFVGAAGGVEFHPYDFYFEGIL
jgi:hypothetical protein